MSEPGLNTPVPLVRYTSRFSSMGHSYDGSMCGNNLTGDFSRLRSRCRKLTEVIIVTEPSDHEFTGFGSGFRSNYHVLSMFALFDELSNMFARLIFH
jgi:hypothetical protein